MSATKSIFKVSKRTPAFGFESTWRYKCNQKQKDFDDDNSNGYGGIDTDEMIRDRAFMAKFYKLKLWSQVTNDPYNIEIPSRKITNKSALLKAFKGLSILMATKGFIESSRSFNNNFEGGGHIHIDYGAVFGDLGYGNEYHLRSEFRCLGIDVNLNYDKHNNNKQLANDTFALMIENMTNLIVNNPWVPWAFNAPNDNECAKNNILCERMTTDLKEIRSIGLQDTIKLEVDRKEWAIVVRPELETFEYRFFGMPKTAPELDLHIQVAQAMFKYCLTLTLEGKLIPRKYNTWKDLTKISIQKSIGGLKVFCKHMGIKYTDLDKTGKINNLKIRYAYHKAVMQTSKFEKSNMVLN